MFHFMPNVWSCQIIIKSLWIIFNLNFLFSAALVLSLDKLFVQLVSWEGLNKGVELFLLVISSWTSRVNEDLRTNDRCQYFRFICLILLDVYNNEEMEILTLIVISGRWKLHGAEINLAVDHLHFAIPADSHIQQNYFIWPLIVPIFFDCEYLCLR